MDPNRFARRSDCPAASVLIDWFDGALDAHATDRVEEHLDRCASCRTWLDDWSERLEGGALEVEPSPTCPEAETLLAYGTASPSADPARTAHVERHLRECETCVQAVARFIALERQRPHRAAATAAVEALPAPARAAGRDVMAAAAAWWQQLREWLTPNVWAGSALAVTAALVLALGVSHLVQPGEPSEDMRVRDVGPDATVEITADTVGRARPSVAEPVVVPLTRGTQARRLAASNGWTRVELADGRRVWVQSESVAVRQSAGASAVP